MDIYNKLYEFYSDYKITKLDFEESALVEDVFSANEFFYHLNHKSAISYSKIKLIRTSDLVYDASNKLFNTFGNFIRIVDADGELINLKIALGGLFYLIGDKKDYNLTYNTDKYYNYFYDSEIESTVIFVNGFPILNIKYYQSYFGEHLENIQAIALYNIDLIELLIGEKNETEHFNSIASAKNMEFTNYIVDDTGTENKKIILDAYITESQIHLRQKRYILAYISLTRASYLLDTIRSKTGMYSDGYRNNLKELSSIVSEIREKYLEAKEEEVK